MKRQAKDLLAVIGALLLAIYAALYFVRTDVLKMGSGRGDMTMRLFKTETEMRIYTPLIKIEEFFRRDDFCGQAPE